MFCFPNTRQEILFPSNLVLFTCISAHNQLRRKEKVSGSPRTSIGKTKHLGPLPAAPRRAPPRPLRPVHTYPFFVWKQNFFLRFGLPSTRIGWNASFQNALQSGDFWKRRLFIYVWTDTYDDAAHLMLPAWSMLSKGCFFSVFVWTGVWMCILWKRRWMCILWKYQDVCGLGLRLRPDESAYILFYTNRPSVHTKPVNQLYTPFPKLKKSIYSTLVSSQNPSTLFLISHF